jgi:predicted RNase H-like HicB family nuclease
MYVGAIPQLSGCHTQGASVDHLVERIREAAELYLEVESMPAEALHLAGVQRITIAAQAVPHG